MIATPGEFYRTRAPPDAHQLHGARRLLDTRLEGSEPRLRGERKPVARRDEPHVQRVELLVHAVAKRAHRHRAHRHRRGGRGQVRGGHAGGVEALAEQVGAEEHAVALFQRNQAVPQVHLPRYEHEAQAVTLKVELLIVGYHSWIAAQPKARYLATRHRGADRLSLSTATQKGSQRPSFVGLEVRY